MKYFHLDNIKFYLGDITKAEAIEWILTRIPYKRKYVEENLNEVL
jgi:hypothetical protein